MSRRDDKRRPRQGAVDVAKSSTASVSQDALFGAHAGAYDSVVIEYGKATPATAPRLVDQAHRRVAETDAAGAWLVLAQDAIDGLVARGGVWKCRDASRHCW